MITINGAKNIQFIGIENYGLLYSRLFLHFNYLGVLLAISIVGGGLAFPILFYRNPARTGDLSQFEGPFRIGLTLAIVYFTYVVDLGLEAAAAPRTQPQGDRLRLQALQRGRRARRCRRTSSSSTA